MQHKYLRCFTSDLDSLSKDYTKQNEVQSLWGSRYIMPCTSIFSPCSTHTGLLSSAQKHSLNSHILPIKLQSAILLSQISAWSTTAVGLSQPYSFEGQRVRSRAILVSLSSRFVVIFFTSSCAQVLICNRRSLALPSDLSDITHRGPLVIIVCGSPYKT